MKARDNPFATHRLEKLPYHFPQGRDWAWLLQRLRELNYRGALVGPEGSGKTTLLLGLQSQLAQQGFTPLYLRCDREHPALSRTSHQTFQISPRHILLLDGAEQLNHRDWKHLLHLSQSGAGLIITSHRPGLLSTILECETSPQLLATLVQQLLPAEHSVSDLPLPTLFQRRNGNLRLALLDLYDQFAAR